MECILFTCLHLIPRDKAFYEYIRIHQCYGDDFLNASASDKSVHVFAYM